MGAASFVQSSFLGGEVSKTLQGRIDDPKYRTWMNVCLNGLPLEGGSWARRPGFANAGTTRNSVAGRVFSFDFAQNTPYTIELTDLHLRARSGTALVTTNDSVVVTQLTAASPAQVVLKSAVTWATGDQAYFSGLGASCAVLQNRMLALTKINTTHFTLSDPLTGLAIDGTVIDVVGLAPTATLNRALDLSTPWGAGSWAALRCVQTETTAFLLTPSVAPYALTVTAAPGMASFATFALAAAVLNDGPYLDPFINGVQAVPSAKKGIVTISLQFPTYDSAAAYPVGAFVTFSAVNYKSLVDQNVGNQPDTHAVQWAAVAAATAISASGFTGADIGRSVRLFSEPDIWAVGTTYGAGAVVSYNAANQPGQAVYYQSVAGSNTGNVPGIDLTNWKVVAQGGSSSPAVWTWGRITSLANAISGSIAGGANIGTMTGGGGLAAAFDGTTNKAGASSAFTSTSGASIDSYVGKNYSGASAQAIGSATLFPSTDFGIAPNLPANGGEIAAATLTSLVINLRAKATVPASASDGTTLGTSGGIGNTLAPVIIPSNDQVTTWNYVWFEIVATWSNISAQTVSTYAAQAQFFNPASTSTGNAINVEILGAPLLYTTPIRTWRLGVYSATTGWPTCGTYSDGRLWLSGVVGNRVDACVSNGILGGTVNFAPTDQYGNVLASSAISYTFTADGVNPILWMTPDIQGIIAGTKAGEWLIAAPTAGGITPLNISARRVSKIGCANIEPRRTDHTTVFVQKFGRKLMEYFADVFSGKFTGPAINWRSKHLTKTGIAEIAYQQELAPVLWGRTVAGALIGWTYKRDTLTTTQEPAIAAGHRHTLGSGRLVESLCTGPSTGGNLDTLTIVTNDVPTGRRHVEVLTDLKEEGDPAASYWLLDDAVTPSSTASSILPAAGAPFGSLTLNGLWHLNGKTVTMTANGIDCGDFVVANGSIVVPYGDGISGGTGSGLFTAAFAATAAIVVGFTYTSDGQIVRPASPQESGARNGPGMFKEHRSHRVGLLVDNTAGVSIGTDFANVVPVLFKDKRGVVMPAGQTYSGTYRDELTDSYSLDGMMCWRSTRPLPANIMAVGPILHTQDL